MKRVLWLLWSLVTLISLVGQTGQAYAQERDERVVAAGERVAGDVSTTTQNIVVIGEVHGDVTSLSGDITVQGRVYGDVVSYGGRVTLAQGGQIDGNVLTLSEPLAAPVTASVAGAVFTPSPLANSLMPTRASMAGLWGVALAGALIFLVALCLLLPRAWPNRSHAALVLLRARPGVALLYGLLTTLLLLLLLPMVTTLLALTLVGLLLLAPLVLAFVVLYGAGFAVLARALVGDAPGSPLGRELLMALLLLTPPLVLAGWAPLAGLGLLLLIGSAGLGAVVLSRGGTLLVRA
jgi:cytoskeletal protein CcmA (bactofilin family)